MSTYLRFRLGPLVHYTRLGRTAAQKRAAAERRAARHAAHSPEGRARRADYEAWWARRDAAAASTEGDRQPGKHGNPPPGRQA